ncbi:MAG: RNA 2',3'-cyclic phosphodiesterase, partial [Rhodospirillaceae bacterium]
LGGIDAATFDLEVSGLGTFGQGYKARALWAGIVPSPLLNHLQAKVESAVVRAGQPPEERKFTPHVTLARFNRPEPQRIQKFIEGNNLFQAGPFRVDHFALFESQRGNAGSVYTSLAEYDLC